LLLGYGSTIRYFPIAFSVYPFFVVAAWKKGSRFLLNALNMLLAVPFGMVLGVPFLFIFFSKNYPLFVEEMKKYVLPWYETPVSNYLSSVLGLLLGTSSSLPPLSSFSNVFYQPIYFRLLYEYGVGALGFVFIFVGILTLLAKHRKASLLLLPVPVILFTYITVYIMAKYDRLVIPVIPFAALFSATGIIFFADRISVIFKRFTPSPQSRNHVLILVTALVVLQPFSHSALSSVRCGQEHSYYAGLTWMLQNIPQKSKIMYKQQMLIPDDIYQLSELNPWHDYFLEEARLRGTDYVFFNKSSLIYYMGTLETDHFFTPRVLKENYYINLALREYDQRAQKLHEITYPDMCEMPDLLYYKMPEALSPTEEELHRFPFDIEQDMSFWKSYPYKQSPSDASLMFDIQEGHDDPGSVSYQWSMKKYLLPRVISQEIPVALGGVYTVSGWVLFSEPLLENGEIPSQHEPDGFFRMDFYNEEDYDVLFPGDYTALSPRYFGDKKWKELTVTAQAPSEAKFMRISFQVNGVKNGGIYHLDDLVVRGPR
ncbi:hypothetical protein HY469_04875, partial [Candidatus Roizmanbacteria bacterium]|nr:hypothetical protein [Candidatus Roizmanbacteria bacterium]